MLSQHDFATTAKDWKQLASFLFTTSNLLDPADHQNEGHTICFTMLASNSSISPIPILRTNVQPGRPTTATAAPTTTPKRRQRFGVVSANIRIRYHHLFLCRSRNSALTSPQLAAHCSNYLCPGTLACVHFPHHCPCPFPAVEDKVELGEGSAICVSKGGWKEGEAARKIELARKGML